MLAHESAPGIDSRRIEAFRLLGLPVGSDREAVIHAYRQLARAIHPDVSADPNAADRFATLTAAYRVASEVPGPDADRARATRLGRHAGAMAQDGEDLVDDGSAAPDRPLGGAWAMRMSPKVRARSWQRPPIVAGPVRVRPSRSGDRGRVSDG